MATVAFELSNSDPNLGEVLEDIFGNVICVIQLTDLMIQRRGLHNGLEFSE